MALKIHLITENTDDYRNMKEYIDNREIQTPDGLIKIQISQWDYSFSNFSMYKNQTVEKPDVLLMFDHNQYSTTDFNGKEVGYKLLLEDLKEAKLLLPETKFVFILPAEKESELSLLNRLMAIDVQDFHFSPAEFNIDVLSNWITHKKTFHENEKYISLDEGKTSKVLVQKEIEHTEVLLKEKDAQVIQVMSVRSSGATFIAAHLAYAFESINKYVSLIDIDLMNQGLFHYFHSSENNEVHQFNDVEKTEWNMRLSGEKNKIKIITSNLKQYEKSSFQQLQSLDFTEIIDRQRTISNYTIVDYRLCNESYDSRHLKIHSQMANTILLVTQLDYSSICKTCDLINTLKEHSVPQEKIHLVFNRTCDEDWKKYAKKVRLLLKEKTGSSEYPFTHIRTCDNSIETSYAGQIFMKNVSDDFKYDIGKITAKYTDLNTPEPKKRMNIGITLKRILGGIRK